MVLDYYKSDHRGVYLCIDVCRTQNSKKRMNKIRKRFIPGHLCKNSVGATSRYHEELDGALTVTGIDGESIANLVLEASQRSSQEGALPAEEFKIPSELHELLQARRSATDAELRKTLSKQIWKQMRQKRKQANDDKLDAILAAGQGALGFQSS
jgi:Zn-dependent oligopeptidase